MYFWRELFDSIAPQNAEIRTVTNSLPLNSENFAKSLFLNRLYQIGEKLKYKKTVKHLKLGCFLFSLGLSLLIHYEFT